MLPAHIENALVEIEHCFNNVSVALVSGEPVALMAASELMRQASADCSAFVSQLSSIDRKNKDLKLRLGKIAVGMAAQRESLIRRTALVEMALNAVVPATSESTYAKAAGPYGSAGKQSGTFKYLAA